MSIRFVLVLLFVSWPALCFADEAVLDPHCRASASMTRAMPGGQEIESGRSVALENGGTLVVLQFKPAPVPSLKIWGFYVIENGCYTKAVTIGAYPTTTEFARARGEIGPNDVMYHADLYDTQMHATLQMYGDTPPTFQEAKDLALQTLGLK